MQTGDLSFEESGAGVALVLVHGFPFDHSLWEGQVGELDGWAHTFAVDLPGFGNSPHLSDEPSISAFADALALWTTQEGIGRFVLVGHSMGGYVALDYACRYIESLQGLILMCTRPGADTEAARENRFKQAEAVKNDGPRVVVDAMLGKLLAPGGENAALSDRLREIMMRQPSEGIVAALHAMAGRRDYTEDLERINVPTLIVSGAQDQIIPAADQETLTNGIRSARHVSIAGAGHVPMLEQPEELNRIMSDFLSHLGEDLAP